MWIHSLINKFSIGKNNICVSKKVESEKGPKAR